MDEQLILQQKQKRFDRRVFWGLALAAVFLTFLICPFSPIFRYNFEPDEICYHTMSLGWLRGKLPYRDLFDHKGPLTYIIYALGLLLTGKNSIGIMFVFMAINAAVFIYIYRILKLCFERDRALGGTILLLILFFLIKGSLYASGTKPDHFILLMLLISEYIYVRGIKRYGDKQKATKSDSAETEAASSKIVSTPVYTYREMLLMGLCCGAVFMIKLNVCIYFFLFVGIYFLWLLIRKLGKAFLASCGMFLLGIAGVSAPFFAYFYAKDALSDFLYAYFQFNTGYARSGGIHILMSRPFISSENKLIIIILFAMLGLASCVFLSGKTNKWTHRLLIICGLLTYVVLAFPEVFAYSFVLLIPLYIWGCMILVDLLFAFLSPKSMHVALGVLATFITVNFTLYNLVILPSLPKEPTEFELKMDEYYEAHPDSTNLYFWNLCDMFFYSKTTTTPDFKYFYIPREADEDITRCQIDYVKQGVPDVIAFLRTPDFDDAFISKMNTFFTTNGYVLYFDDTGESEYYAYVRASTLDDATK